jgi:hypothetical protein
MALMLLCRQKGMGSLHPIRFYFHWDSNMKLSIDGRLRKAAQAAFAGGLAVASFSVAAQEAAPAPTPVEAAPAAAQPAPAAAAPAAAEPAAASAPVEDRKSVV